MKKPLIACLFSVLILWPLTAPVVAQTSLHDPSLPTVKSEVLRQLSNDRIRQRIMRQSQAHYAGRCVCAYMTKDTNGRPCKGRHVVIKSEPQPICYPGQVTDRMVTDWRGRHR